MAMRYVRFLTHLAHKWRVPVAALERIASGSEASPSPTRIATLRRISTLLNELLGEDDAQCEYLKELSPGQKALGFRTPWHRLLEDPRELFYLEDEVTAMKNMHALFEDLYPGHPYPDIAAWNDLNGNDPKFKLPYPYGTQCIIRDDIAEARRRGKPRPGSAVS